MKKDWQARGGWFVVAQFALLGFIFFAPDPIPSFEVPTWLAWAFTLTGWGLLIWAAFSLGRNLTPLPHPRDDGTLVTTGVFGVVRHPIYSALMLLAVGSALGRGSWFALTLTVALSVLLEFKSRLEEAKLLERFPTYAAYRSRVKKFVPWVY
jgi:protein-S-isoprenylcysteine O-methyltransferase Ste14